MSDIPHFDASTFPQWAERLRRDHHRQYFAMYSSVLGGIVTDPVLMVVPVDDHLVHRGDGVFETLKCVEGAIYNMEAHLDRLEASARQIALPLPCSRPALASVVVATARAGRQRNCALRVLVSRGPGSLGINPYECPRSELYVVAAVLSVPAEEKFTRGATARFSQVPVKPGFFATIKSCNYLPNVLMKKEAVDGGVDFVLSLDERNCLAEGPAESAAIVSPDLRLQMPAGSRVLPGTTLQRVVALAAKLITDGTLTAVESCDIPRAATLRAVEVLIIGTTPDVIPIVRLDGAPVGNGHPGPVARKLGELLRRDIREAPGVRTVVFE